jgi:hypothetical protein
MNAIFPILALCLLVWIFHAFGFWAVLLVLL